LGSGGVGGSAPELPGEARTLGPGGGADSGLGGDLPGDGAFFDDRARFRQPLQPSLLGVPEFALPGGALRILP
jgi:hypothetical protein